MPCRDCPEDDKVARLSRPAGHWLYFLVNLWSDSIASRIAIILAAAMLLTQFLGYLLFFNDRSGLWPQSYIDGLVAQIKAPAQAILEMPQSIRTEALRSFGSADFELAASPIFDPKEQAAVSPPFGRLRDRLLLGMPGLVDQIIVEGRMADRSPAIQPFVLEFDPKESVTLWLRLADRSWMTVKLPLGGLVLWPPFHTWLFWGDTIFLVVIISLYAAGTIADLLQRCAEAADQLGVNIAAPLTASGPREMRTVARSFNRMQTRIKRFVDDRTQMLAAISHDLRTPLSRLRLRAELQAPGFEKQKNLADLELMDRMITATLSFASNDVVAEPRVKIDLVSLIQTVCDEISETGGRTTYQGRPYLEIEAAPLSLKRAVTNVIDNAVKYGSYAQVSLVPVGSTIKVVIVDGGPGIPLSEQERVFEPFYRLGPARSPDRDIDDGGDLGGIGLGLAIARHILRAHGGDVTLSNGPDVGLVVSLILPGFAHSAGA